MQKINSAIQLHDAIIELEKKQNSEGKILKEQFHIAYESVKPINLIKSTFKEVTASKDLKDNLINTAVGITAGYLSKKILDEVTDDPLKKLLGTAVIFGITNTIAKNPDIVKAVAKGIFNIFAGPKPTHIERVR